MFVTQQMRIVITTNIIARSFIVSVIPTVKKEGQIWPRAK